MSNQSNMCACFFAIGIYALLVPIANGMPGGDAAGVAKGKLPHGMPDIVRRLVEWRDSFFSSGRVLAHDDPDIVVPQKDCHVWVHKVIDPSWLPENEPEPMFVRNAVDDHDMARYRWTTNGYDIEVSQTVSIFAMKLTPQDGRSMGKSNQDKLNVARELCLSIFAKQGKRWTDQGQPVVLNDLAEKIASYSFGRDTIQNAEGDNIVIGRPRTMEQEGVRETQDRTQRLAENSASNSSWDITARAWNYWFRTVKWQNDGNCLAIYFLKIEDGPSDPDYRSGAINKRWFGPPKDRLGRPIAVKPER